MRLETKKYLYDMQQATDLLGTFMAGKNVGDYEKDPMLRAAVEREFQIVGEALARLAKDDPDVASQITEFRRIVAFRNILIHGYAEVDHRLVWDVVENKLPALGREGSALLGAS